MLAPNASCDRRRSRVGRGGRAGDRRARRAKARCRLDEHARTRRRRSGRRVSLGRVTSSKRAATCMSSWSPTSWPKLSLICLKPSRSTSSKASGSRERARARERMVEPVAEERAVGKPGQAVVEGLARELLLEHHALADVARVEHDAAHVLLAAQVGDVRLDVAPLAEAVADAEDDLAAARRCAHVPATQRAVVGMHDRGEAVLEQLALLSAEHGARPTGSRSGSRPRRRRARGRSRR